MKEKPTIELDEFTGINNQIEGSRLSFETSSRYKKPHQLSLIEAINIDIDDSGMLLSRNGYYLSLSGSFSNLWSNGDICLFNNNGSIESLSPDLKTHTVILSGLDPTANIEFLDINGDVFLTNGSVIGYIRSNIFYSLTDPGKTFKSVMPAGRLLTALNHRLFVVQDYIVVYSDPATYHYYDKRKNYLILPDRITMMKSVSDGIFISTIKSTYFMAGLSPEDFILTKVADYPANSNSAVYLEAPDVKVEGISEQVVVWSSPKGICLGSKGGNFINLTESKYQMFQSDSNASLAYLSPGKNQYIFLSEIQKAEIEAGSYPFVFTSSMAATLS